MHCDLSLYTFGLPDTKAGQALVEIVIKFGVPVVYDIDLDIEKDKKSKTKKKTIICCHICSTI